MPNPTFDIQIATNSAESRVTCNGEDISGAIRAVQITQVAGSLPIVRLQLSGGSRGASFRLQAEALGILDDKLDQITESDTQIFARVNSAQSTSDISTSSYIPKP